MNTTVLTLALLVGPGPDINPDIKRHVVQIAIDPKGFQSRVVQSELGRKNWRLQHLSREVHFYCEVKFVKHIRARGLDCRTPAYKIGRGDRWHPFPPGCCVASGTCLTWLHGELMDYHSEFTRKDDWSDGDVFWWLWP